MDNKFIGVPDELNNKHKHDRVCKNCGRKILYNPDPKADLCPMCKELQLFADVRDYIRANDVKDYEVAEHFGISLSKVNEWIKQGRIQYKDDPTIQKVIMGNYCQICGSPLNFGTVCPACMKMKKKSETLGVAINQNNASGDNKMQLIDKNKK